MSFAESAILRMSPEARATLERRLAQHLRAAEVQSLKAILGLWDVRRASVAFSREGRAAAVVARFRTLTAK